jgi:hypothetical protein
MLLTYAGIGTRKTSKEEEEFIKKIAKKLSEKFIVLSGNAQGSDLAWQQGSEGKCVIMLPWLSFNKNYYDVKNSLDYYDVGSNSIGREYAKKFHPNYSALDKYGKMFMCRNTFQILGYDKYPQVSFVVFCANEIDGKVFGGTAQAIRIARSMDIPTFNIRSKTFREDFTKYMKEKTYEQPRNPLN